MPKNLQARIKSLEADLAYHRSTIDNVLDIAVNIQKLFLMCVVVAFVVGYFVHWWEKPDES